VYSIHKQDATVFDLSGRRVNVFVGGDKLVSKTMTVGLTEVPGETRMAPHTHEDKEEIIYVI